MERSLSAAEANREFSRLLREVREGRTYVVTSHGKPVARIMPVGNTDKVTKTARKALFSRLRNQPILGIGSWSRDSLYERDR